MTYVLQMYDVFSKRWADRYEDEDLEIVKQKLSAVREMGFRKEVLRIVKRQQEVVFE